jgi:hypothetical protein
MNRVEQLPGPLVFTGEQGSQSQHSSPIGFVASARSRPVDRRPQPLTRSSGSSARRAAASRPRRPPHRPTRRHRLTPYAPIRVLIPGQHDTQRPMHPLTLAQRSRLIDRRPDERMPEFALTAAGSHQP